MQLFEALESRALLSSSAAAGDWLSQGGGGTRAGYATGNLSGMVAEGVGFNFGDQSTAADVVSQGNLTFRTSNSFVAAYDGAANQAWKNITFGYASGAGLTLYNGVLYYTLWGGPGGAGAIDASSGHVLWGQTYATPSFGPPINGNGAPYVDTSGIYLVTAGGDINRAGFDGTLLSTSSTGLKLEPFAGDGSDGARYLRSESYLERFDSDGTVAWTNTAVGQANVSTADVTPIDATRAYAPAPDHLTAVDRVTGATAWTATGSFTGSPAVAGQDLFANSGNSVLRFDVATGAPLASYVADDQLEYQPLVTDDSVIVTSAFSTYIFDRATGTLVQKLGGGGHLSLGNGLLFANNQTSVEGYPLAVYSFHFVAGNRPTISLPTSPVEGTTVQLSGTSTGPGVAKWEWDTDYSASAGFVARLTGQDVAYSVADGPSSHVVALRTTDASGNTQIVTQPAQFANAAPTASASVKGRTVTVAPPLSGAYDVAGDTVKFSYDFDGDGTWDLTDVADSAELIPAAAVLQAGPDGRVLKVRVSDEDGGQATYDVPWSVASVDRSPVMSGTPAKAGDKFTLNLDASLVPGNLTGWDIDWGDGTTSREAPGATTSKHTYAFRGNYAVAASLGRDLGAVTAEPLALTILPAGLAPKVECAGFLPAARGDAALRFQLRYSATDGIDVATLGNGDATVTRPGRDASPALFESSSAEDANGTSVLATYSIAPMGGTYLTAADAAACLVTVAQGSVSTSAGIGAVDVNMITLGPVTATLGAPAPSTTAADLTVSVLGTPPVLKVGARSTLSAAVSNAGVAVATGATSVRFVFSSDPVYDASDPAMVEVPIKKLKLSPGKKITVKGSYTAAKAMDGSAGYILAIVDPNSRISDGQHFNNDSVGTAQTWVLATYLDIGGTMRVSGKPRSGKQVFIAGSIYNHGNRALRGPYITLDLVRVTDGGEDVIDSISGTPKPIGAGSSASLTGHTWLYAGEPGTYLLRLTISNESDYIDVGLAQGVITSAPFQVT